MTIPTNKTDVLDREFLELRAGLLQVAAQLDRLDRAEGNVSSDPRRQNIAKAIEALSAERAGRAEQIQLIFSRPYEDRWREKMELMQK